MAAREELEAVAAEEGWTLAVPLSMYAVYIRDELIHVTELSDPPGFAWLQSGARRWEVNAPDAVLETALAWLRDPYETVHADLDVDAALERVRAELMDVVAQTKKMPPLADTLRAALDTREIR